METTKGIDLQDIAPKKGEAPKNVDVKQTEDEVMNLLKEIE